MTLIQSSHRTTGRPSVMLALLAASIVTAFDRTWLVRPVADLCRDLNVRPEVPCRLKARLLESIEALVARATRKGRPGSKPAEEISSRFKATEALLAVAADIARTLGVRSRALQDRLVAAEVRLAGDHGINRRTFCQTLGLSERTFRSWVARPPKITPLVVPDPPRPPRPVKRGRFALDVVPAGIQAIADTTDWKLFDVPLKIVALQDPGARATKLWDGFEVAMKENANTVVRVVTEALEKSPGTQILTDQGTPYLAAEAREAYENLELEHAPQKEAHPTAKATLERSFGTVKQALEPLARLTHRLAEKIPALRSEPLATNLGKLLLSTFLTVYFASRTPRERPGADPEVFAILAERSRERARAEDRSRRLTLERIHAQYQMPGSKACFVRAFRGCRVEDILEAERRMGERACRCHAKKCDRYFAAIVRQVTVEMTTRRASAREQALHRAQDRELIRRLAQRRAQLEENPSERVIDALDRIACFWQSDKGAFSFDPPPFTELLRRAIDDLANSDPLASRDRLALAWRIWCEKRPNLDEKLKTSLRAVIDRTAAAIQPSTPPLTTDLVRGMLINEKHTSNGRPPPHPNLRI